MSEPGDEIDDGETQGPTATSQEQQAAHLTLVSSKPVPARSWTAKLLRSGGKGGAPKKILANAMLPLREAPEWRETLCYDASALAVIISRQPPAPWPVSAVWQPRPWTDHDDSLFTEWLQKRSIDVGITIAGDAVQSVARERSIHPIRDYLVGLTWDKTPRIDKWLHCFLGAADTPYHAIVGARWLISGVARIMVPGCKADSILQLEGPQGLGKGTALEILAVQSKWFSDEVRGVGGPEAAMSLAGRWIIEFAELTALQGKTAEVQKSFITRTVDRYRPPYGRSVGDFPRQCIFAASTNRYETLSDVTGNRRFWPIRCGRIDVAGLRQVRDQLWAEAKARFGLGENWWLDTEESRALATAAQEERFEADVSEDTLVDFLADVPDEVTLAEVMQEFMKLDPVKATRADQRKAGDMLRHLGWERAKSWDKERKRMRWVFQRPQADSIRLASTRTKPV